MLNKTLLSVLLVIFLAVISNDAAKVQATVSCSPIDRAALLSFKAGITQDATGILSSWTSNDCCGGWDGVECDENTGRVTSLQLQSGGVHGGAAGFMRGTLSPSLGDLEFLKVLVITGMKQITGGIPKSLSNLRNLKQLYLEESSLEGIIPESLGKLPYLQALSFAGNRLQGQLPASLGFVPGLIQVNLGRNLLSGPIPHSFRNLVRVQFLDLNSNLFSGDIPTFLGRYENLVYLDLSNNRFSGLIPRQLGLLSKLSSLLLNNNKLTGELPGQIGKLHSLTTLSVSGNSLSGSLPESLARLRKLWNLDLSRNEFTGTLPASFATGLPSLSSVNLSYNKFSPAKFPTWLRERELEVLHLAGCNITDNIGTFARPGSLNSLDLSDNYLTGDISNFITSLSSIRELKLSSNQLYGSVSTFLRKITKGLEVLDISKNKITGNLPELGTRYSLKWLDISRNQIGGSIPASLGQMVTLEYLDLSRNYLNGKIPDSLLKLTVLKHANFRGNMLCGQIPQGKPLNALSVKAYAHNKCLCGAPLPPCKRV